MRKLSFCIVLVACVVAAWGQRGRSFWIDGIKYSVVSEEELTVTVAGHESCVTELDTLHINRSVEKNGVSYTVIGISCFAFQNCHFNELTLPSSLRFIDQCAFSGANFSNARLRLPDSVETIGQQAFSQTRGLNWFRLPARLRKLGENVFQTTAISELIVPEENQHFCMVDGVLYSKDTTILWSIPLGLRDTVLTLPRSLRHIASNAFYHSAIRHITLPDSLLSIGEDAFLGSRLRELHIPASVRSLAGGFIGGCVDLNNLTIDPASTHYRLASDGYSIFSADGDSLISCHKAAGEYIIPSSIKAVGGFSNCSNLTTVRLHEGITTILPCAFASTNVDTIRFPRSLRTIGNGAFYCFGKEFHSWFSPLPDSMDYIGSWAFYYNGCIDTIRLPHGLKHLSYNAFGASAMTAVVWNNDVEVIEPYAFSSRTCYYNITSRVRTVCDSAIACGLSVLFVTFRHPVDTMGLHCIDPGGTHVNLKLANRTPPVMTGYTIFSRDGYDRATIYIPCGSLQAYLDDPLWGRYAECYKEYDCPPENIDDQPALPKPRVLLSGLSLTVKDVEGMPIAIHDTLGRLILRDDTSAPTRHYTLPHPGLYLLRTPHHTLKLLAR